MWIQTIQSPVLLERITSLIREMTTYWILLPLLLAISNLFSVCCSFSSCCVLVLAFALWPYNSNYRMQILAHTIELLSLSLSYTHTHFLHLPNLLYQPSLSVPIFLSVSPFFLLPFSPSLPRFLPTFHFLTYCHFSILPHSLCPLLHTRIPTPSYLATFPYQGPQAPENGTWLTEASGMGLEQSGRQDRTQGGGRNSREMQNRWQVSSGYTAKASPNPLKVPPFGDNYTSSSHSSFNLPHQVSIYSTWQASVRSLLCV